MEISRIEFNDEDDPESNVHLVDLTRFKIAPEGMALWLPNAKNLTSDDQMAIGKMLRMAYEQGKRVSALCASQPAEPEEK